MPGSPELSRTVGRLPEGPAQTRDGAGSADAARPEKGYADGRAHDAVGAPPRRRRDEPPDEALLRAVYEEHGQAVLAYANRLVRDRHAAADVVQETFLRAWRHPEVLVRGHGRVRGWLLAVARNIVIDRARALAIRPQEVPDVAIELGGGGIAAEPDHADRVAAAVAVTSAMAGLSSDHQQVLRHLYWGDRSVADTAADIGITVGTVKSRAHYAIAALRTALARGEGR